MGEEGTGVVDRESRTCLLPANGSGAVAFLVFFDLLIFCDDVFASAEDVFAVLGWSLFGASRSPSTFLDDVVDLVDFFLTSSSSGAASIFSSRTISDDAALDDAFVVRVDLVERVAFLTGMLCAIVVLNVESYQRCFGECFCPDTVLGWGLGDAVLSR